MGLYHIPRAQGSSDLPLWSWWEWTFGLRLMNRSLQNLFKWQASIIWKLILTKDSQHFQEDLLFMYLVKTKRNSKKYWIEIWNILSIQLNLQSVKVILHEVYDVANLIIKVNSNYDWWMMAKNSNRLNEALDYSIDYIIIITISTFTANQLIFVCAKLH